MSVVVNKYRGYSLVIDDFENPTKLDILDKNGNKVSPEMVSLSLQRHLLFPYLMNIIADMALEHEDGEDEL